MGQHAWLACAVGESSRLEAVKPWLLPPPHQRCACWPMSAQ